MNSPPQPLSSVLQGDGTARQQLVYNVVIPLCGGKLQATTRKLSFNKRVSHVACETELQLVRWICTGSGDGPTSVGAGVLVLFLQVYELGQRSSCRGWHGSRRGGVVTGASSPEDSVSLDDRCIYRFSIERSSS